MTIPVFGIDVPVEIVVAVISAAAILLGIVLNRHFDRRRLGDFKDRSLESSIGVEKDGRSLAGQHSEIKESLSSQLSNTKESISSQLGNTKESISSQLGNTKDIGSITNQTQNIMKAVDAINNRIIDDRSKLFSLSPEQFNLKNTVDSIEKITKQWLELINENTELKEQILSLQEELYYLKRDLRTPEKESENEWER